MLRVKCKQCGTEALRRYAVGTPIEDVVGFPCYKCGGEVWLTQKLPE